MTARGQCGHYTVWLFSNLCAEKVERVFDPISGRMVLPH